MLETTERTIDLDRIIREKMGTKARYVPSVAVRWLKHIIHQDEVNRFLWESRDKKGTEWLEECTRYLDMTIDIEGLENLPDKNDGRLYTFVSNHPLGGVDGVALGAIIGRHYDGRFRYLAAMHPHQQDGETKPELPRDGGGGILRRQPYTDVSGRHLLTQD